MSTRKCPWRVSFIAGIAALALPPVALAQEVQASDEPEAAVAEVAAATLRTPEEMAAFAATYAPPLVDPEALPLVNRPDMDPQLYEALKAAADGDADWAAAARIGRPAAPPSNDPVPSTPPALDPVRCNGIGQLAPVAGGWIPPDTHGAVGDTQFAQIVNSAYRVYTKANTGNCPTAQLLNTPLYAFFGYTEQTLFDPRVVYDMTYDRWIVTAEGFPETDGDQWHYVAVSRTPDAAGAYWIYRFNVGTMFNGLFWDYPQLGYDEEAIIITANLFTETDYAGVGLFFLPKHRMYAGLGFSYCWFGGPWNPPELNYSTTAPPLVLDQGPYTALVAAAAAPANNIRMTKWVGTSRACPMFLGYTDIPYNYSVPPSARQPGYESNPAYYLDTIGGRFQNASTQRGMPVFGVPVTLWQTNTTGDFGYATPHALKINADAGTLDENCQYWTGSLSYDFNPAIAANYNGDIFITYSSTDPSLGLNAQVRMTGKKAADGCGTLFSDILVNQSGNPLTGNYDPNKGLQRWGDYSAVTIDPSNSTKAWGTNEKIQNKDATGLTYSTWKSYFFNMRNP
jgi:hypothetical protein